MDETDGPETDGGDGNEEFERLVQAVAHELKQDDEFNAGDRNVISRRGALAGLLGLGSGVGLASMTGNVQAAGEDFTSASGTVGTDSQPLSEVNSKQGHFQALESGEIGGGVAPSPITNIAGSNLSVDTSGNLNASGGGGGGAANTVYSSDYSDINAAIQALPTNGGRLVIDQYHTINYSIDIDRHLLITGESKGHWSLNPTVGIELADGFTGSMFRFQTDERYTKLSGLMLSGGDGNGDALIDSNGYGVRYLTLMGCFITRVANECIRLIDGGWGFRISGYTTIENNRTNSDLVRVDGQDRVQIGNTYLTHQNISEGRDGLYLSNINRLVVSNVLAKEVGRSPLYLSNVTDFLVSAFNAYLGGQNSSYTGHMIHLDGCSNGYVDALVQGDGNENSLLDIDSTSSDILVEGMLNSSGTPSKTVNGTNVIDHTQIPGQQVAHVPVYSGSDPGGNDVGFWLRSDL